MNKCTFCGIETSNKRFCSNKCVCDANNAKRRIHTFIEKQCEICNKAYKAYSANKSSKYCSRDCAYEWKRKAYKGRKLTPEWYGNMQFAKRRENIIKHGDYECEKCSKKFETNLSLRSHRSYCNHDDRQPTVCEICGVILKVKRALAMHMRKHDATWKANHSKVVSMALANRKPPKRISDEENKFYERLRTLYGNEVTHSFRIDGVNHEFDFFVPSKNLLIEYDGDYWHGNKATQQILTPAMKRQFRIDEKFTRAAEKAGYVVHRVWGSESKQYPSKRRTEFNDFINKD